MKGSDKIGITINIGGELIQLDVKFDEQNSVRDTEFAIKNYINQLKAKWPNKSDRNILAMAVYQFAKSYHHLLKIQQQAIEITKNKCRQLDLLKDHSHSESNL